MARIVTDSVAGDRPPASRIGDRGCNGIGVLGFRVLRSHVDASGLREVLTVAGLRHVLTACPGLRELILNGMDLTGAAGEQLAVALQLPGLEVLHLDGCPGLDDEALAAIVGAVPTLREVSLRGSAAITDARVTQLQRRHPDLRFVR